MTYDDKIRLRSDAELKHQNDGLIMIKQILDNIKVINYLSSGTLLGAVRDKDFIKWDWDVQMYLLMENAFPLRYEITKSLKEAGFNINKFYDNNDSLKWEVRRKGAIFELTAWWLQDKWRYRKKRNMRVPSYLFEKEYKINFKGVNYRTLNPPEEYLEFCYGDWKTPLRTSDKKLYTNSRHYKHDNILDKSVFFVKKIIIKVINFIFKS